VHQKKRMGDLSIWTNKGQSGGSEGDGIPKIQRGRGEKKVKKRKKQLGRTGKQKQKKGGGHERFREKNAKRRGWGKKYYRKGIWLRNDQVGAKTKGAYQESGWTTLKRGWG